MGAVLDLDSQTEPFTILLERERLEPDSTAFREELHWPVLHEVLVEAVGPGHHERVLHHGVPDQRALFLEGKAYGIADPCELKRNVADRICQVRDRAPVGCDED